MTSILSTISVTFLGLMAALLGVAMLMEALPAYGRYLVFPFVLTGWLISLCLHEFGHAVVAYRSGDRSVVGNGYLTLDPLRYTDVQFSIFWPLVYLAIGGIGLPGGAVYLNKNMIRSPVDRSLVSAAGPACDARGLRPAAFHIASDRRDHLRAILCGAGVSRFPAAHRSRAQSAAGSGA